MPSCNQRALLCWGHVCQRANVSGLRLSLSLRHNLPEQSLQSDTCRLPSDYFTALPSSSCTSLSSLVSCPSLFLAGGGGLGLKGRKGGKNYSLFCYPLTSPAWVPSGLERWLVFTLHPHCARLWAGSLVYMTHQIPTAALDNGGHFSSCLVAHCML